MSEKESTHEARQEPTHESTPNHSEQCKLCLLAQHQVSNIKKLYEDDEVVVIWYPTLVAGHIALIPKKHDSIMMSVPDEIMQKIFTLAHRFAREIMQQTNYEGFTLISNNGIDQAHSHFSLHLVPRKKDDGLTFSWQGQTVEDAALGMVEQHLRTTVATAQKEDDVAENFSNYLDRLP